jgi:hypothetical protein
MNFVWNGEFEIFSGDAVVELIRFSFWVRVFLCVAFSAHTAPAVDLSTQKIDRDLSFSGL